MARIQTGRRLSAGTRPARRASPGAERPRTYPGLEALGAKSMPPRIGRGRARRVAIATGISISRQKAHLRDGGTGLGGVYHDLTAGHLDGAADVDCIPPPACQLAPRLCASEVATLMWEGSSVGVQAYAIEPLLAATPTVGPCRSKPPGSAGSCDTGSRAPVHTSALAAGTPGVATGGVPDTGSAVPICEVRPHPLKHRSPATAAFRGACQRG